MKTRLSILGIIFFTSILSSCGGNDDNGSNAKSNSSEESTYEEVRINKQVWMAKNLDVSTFRNGDKIREVKTDLEWREVSDKKEPACCYLKFKDKTYGKYYNWWAVIDDRGLAPDGWHIPSKDEYLELIKGLGGVNDLTKYSDDVFIKAGLKMKSKSGWVDEIGRDGAGNNSSGFNALANGRMHHLGYGWDEENTAQFWSSTRYPFPGNAAYAIYIQGQKGGGKGISDEVYVINRDKGDGLVVRCVKD